MTYGIQTRLMNCPGCGEPMRISCSGLYECNSCHSRMDVRTEPNSEGVLLTPVVTQIYPAPVKDLSHLIRDAKPIDPYVTMSGRAKLGEILELQVAGVKYKVTVTKLGPQWYQIGDKEVCIEGIES